MPYDILIVEDDARTRQTIELFCKGHPHFERTPIRHAENGLAAWGEIQLLEPDLVFLDMEMPGMTGLELLVKLKECNQHFNVVVISGYDSYEYTRKAIQYGTIDYLLKPIRRKQMMNLLDAIACDEIANREFAEEEDNRSDIERIGEYIYQNYAQPLSLTKLAAEFHYSREHLSREFKSKFGVGLTKYITDVRMEHAKVLLFEGTPVNEVCTRVGFYNDSYFAKVFKQKYGVSPNKYLK